MILVKLGTEGNIVSYPISYGFLKFQYPEIVGLPITDELLASYNCYRVKSVDCNIFFDRIYEQVEEDLPELVDGVWYQRWKTRPATEEEVLHSIEQVKEEITNETQRRLDSFAQSGGYDNILSASTYKDSLIPRFNTEGTYCFNMRDLTWAALAGIMQDVLAGTREIPRSFADIEGDLPALIWPT